MCCPLEISHEVLATSTAIYQSISQYDDGTCLSPCPSASPGEVKSRSVDLAPRIRTIHLALMSRHSEDKSWPGVAEI
jgi:hypothetical protein